MQKTYYLSICIGYFIVIVIFNLNFTTVTIKKLCLMTGKLSKEMRFKGNAKRIELAFYLNTFAIPRENDKKKSKSKQFINNCEMHIIFCSYSGYLG